MHSVWIFSFLLFVGVSLAITLDCSNCTLPRVRYRWGSLTSSQQQNYLGAVQQLKNYQEIPYATATYTLSLYDIFSLTHSASNDAAFAHGSDGFYTWHRHFMWTYETALQEVVTAYNKQLLSKKATTGYLDACVTVPYWDWENDYQKETQSIMFSASTFGSYQENCCVTDGAFADWAGAQGYCLWRSLDIQTNGGIAVGAAQIINYIVGHESYDTYRSNIEGYPHGSVHNWIGGTEGDMGNMWSPNDPLFYCHHSNIDRLWALWQDCYNYDKLSTSAIASNNNVFPSSFTLTNGNTVYANQNMPYTVDLDGSTFTSYRFPGGVTPYDMQSIGYGGNTGYNGMYYRYGPDQIVTTLNSMGHKYASVCKFDGWVNYTPPSTKRSLEDSPPDCNDTDSQSLFGSKRLQVAMNDIEQNYGSHNPTQKLHYLALWECSDDNKLANRSYAVPLRWCAMNGIDPDDWKSICEKEGFTDGYKNCANNQELVNQWSHTSSWRSSSTVSYAEQQQTATNNQNQLPSWIIPVSATAAGILLIGIIIGIVFFIRKKRGAEVF